MKARHEFANADEYREYLIAYYYGLLCAGAMANDEPTVNYGLLLERAGHMVERLEGNPSTNKTFK